MNCLDSKIDLIVDEILKKMTIEKDDTILVEASGRHVHLSQESVDVLFGKGYELTKKRELSQPGQYLCEEKVTLIGAKGVIQNVSVLGPVRKDTQVELSKSDGVILGIKPQVKMSGDIKGSNGIILSTASGVQKLEEGVIAAKRHIHITPEDAERFGVKDKDVVSIEICGERGLIFNNVVVRVNKDYSTAVHIDYDEANACGFIKGARAKIVK